MDDSGGAIGEILPDGTLLLRLGSVDMGQGSNSAMAQILSARTGWPFGRIRVHAADSLLDPPAGMTTASRQTFITGNAVLRMADSLNDEIARFIRAEFGQPGGKAAGGGVEESAGSGGPAGRTGVNVVGAAPAPLELRDRVFRDAATGRPVLSLEDFIAAVNRKGTRITASARYSAPATSFSLKEPPRAIRIRRAGDSTRLIVSPRRPPPSR
jgi:CO/xanthine dehydrogenase Mo-binding subunit